MSLRVALTGGIASGKTAVSDRFAALGASVVDTDVIARELVEPGSPALADIADHFGDDILLDSGALDRGRLREIVFNDREAQQQLQAILHPLIRAEALHQAEHATGPYVIVVIPLLAESGGFPGVDRVLLVDVPESVQIERLMARDGSSREAAEAALRAQATRAERQALADDLIENTGSLETLNAKVEALHERYLQLSNEPNAEG